MFDNIGSKIKILARIITYIGLTASVIVTLNMLSATLKLAEYADGGVVFWSFISSLLVGGVLAVAAWIGSFTLYGFGELIDNSAKAVHLLSKNYATSSDNKTFEIKTSNAENTASSANLSSSANSSSHIWICECGKYINQSPCRFCGKDYSSSVSNPNDVISIQKYESDAICAQCGSEFPSSNAFCSKCGHSNHLLISHEDNKTCTVCNMPNVSVIFAKVKKSDSSVAVKRVCDNCIQKYKA